MPQGPFQSLVAILSGSGLTSPNKPLTVTSDGALVVTSDTGGDAVTMAAGAVVAGAYVDGSIATLGTEADAAYASGSGTAIAILKGIFTKVAAALTVKQGGNTYVTCPVSATTALGGAGALGDVLNTLTITPTLAAAGNVSIKDGTNTAVVVFYGGGTTALTNLVPVTITLNATSIQGGWSVICGSGVTAVASGQFA
jgi:hypothetical protein